MAETETKETSKSFNKADLSAQETKDFDFVIERISQLKDTRKNHYGIDLEEVWSDADRDYVPHRLKNKGRKVVATDEEKGWRGTLVSLGSNNWQSDISQANPYVKTNIALSILIDQNPSGVFTPANKKFQATNELAKQLYERSWEHAKSKGQLKLFVFNLAKYGWAVARTYPLRLTRKVKVIKDYDQENPDKTTYEEKEVVLYNDIMRENLDPRNAWIDDMAKPNNPFSLRDWCWRKVYDFDVAKEEFGKYPNWKFVKPGGTVTETVGAVKGTQKEYKSNNLVEIYFYENQVKDLFMVVANGVPVIISPLPISDAKGNKKLSCWQTYWTLRHAESPYGIGIYESIRYDQAILDRIRNMTIDQLTLSIYKMFFYQGTQSLTETGDIKITPGVGKQVLDPKNITWLEIPGPGNEAWQGLDRFKADIDEASGIGDPLAGVVTGKTAFELAQAKEASLKRLKSPLDNILDALNTEGYITVSLIQLLYSIPETYRIADPDLIEAYLKETGGDPELYERDEEGIFTAKVYPEFQLNLDKDEKGNLIETNESQFFRVKPDSLTWEGTINIKSQSLLTPSKQVDKALELEMWNMLSPMMLQMAQERQMFTQMGQPASIDNLTQGKSAKSIMKLYDKDPKDIFPTDWLEETPPPQAVDQPLIVPADQASPQASPGIPPQAPQAEKLTASPEIPAQGQGIVGRAMSALAKPFR